ncbi:MAG: acetyl-CoA carboxylase biotin carboxyl carrier protein [Gemmatimonadota bacterium]
MIDLEFLERLIQALDESSVDSIEIERGGTRVRLSKSPPVAPVMAAPAAVPAAGAASPAADPVAAPAPPSSGGDEGASGGEEASAPASNLIEITSPMVGTFYRAPAPDAPPYVEKGSRISKGDTLCIIEAMKLMNELEAEVDGTIVEILVENAQPVEYGQALFRVSPA